MRYARRIPICKEKIFRKFCDICRPKITYVILIYRMDTFDFYKLYTRSSIDAFFWKHLRYLQAFCLAFIHPQSGHCWHASCFFLQTHT